MARAIQTGTRMQKKCQVLKRRFQDRKTVACRAMIECVNWERREWRWTRAWLDSHGGSQTAVYPGQALALKRGVADRQSGRHGLCLSEFILRASLKLWQAEVNMPVCTRNGLGAVGNDNACEFELGQGVGNCAFVVHVQMTGSLV